MAVLSDDNPENNRPSVGPSGVDDDAHIMIARLERQLAQQSERAERAEADARAFRELAEHIEEVFWMTNAMGDELVYISPAYEAIWGQTCESLHAEPGRRLAWVHEADRERVLKAFKRDARAGEYSEVFRIDRPDGEIRWIHDRAWPVYDDHKRLYRLAGFANDVTADMDEHDRMAELGAALTGRERMCVFATLGTTIAHDLSQPLTAARNQLARLRSPQTGDAADGAHIAKLADDQLKRASDIIHHMRDFARQGRPSLSRHGLGSVLDELHELTATALRRQEIDYQLVIDNDTRQHEIAIDRVLVQQILRNLIDNAIEAIAVSDVPKSAGMIQVTAALQTDGTLAISVADNGEGMEQGITPFAAFDSTKVEGLGLGLHISRSLARSHGGSLELASATAPMQTCLVFRLPASAADASAA